METKKIEKIPGTHYVRIGSNAFNTMPANSEPNKVKCLCLFCGEKFSANSAGQCSVYCQSCKKAENRKKMTEENKAIKQENLTKGFKYAT
jgi:L-lysine 2,3-aminomutase